MKTEDTIPELRGDLERYAETIRQARASLRGADLLSPSVGSIAHDLRRLAAALMADATELQQAQRVAAAEARTDLVVG